ncbi:ABC transporter substrate-binding protein [Zymobacter sp. IVIA_12111.31 C1]|uniref:ABC transporter substrate-binding protein n=1 Tax=Zymobacter sp. IVIA_12111.31 C1 TaxID=3394854 RepID=UPI0039C0B4FB
MTFKRVLTQVGKTSALLLSLAAAHQATAKDIAIGYQAPLTGEYAQYGQAFRNSATLAVDEFNASKRLPNDRIVLKFEDSKSDAKEAVNIARKFADDSSIVGVIGDFSSTASIAAGRVYANAHVPQLSQTASHPDFVKLSPWQFRNITTMAYEAPRTAEWAHENGVKRIAIIAIQNDWGQSSVAEFTKAFKAQGGEVVATEFYNPGTRDFRSIITKTARNRPDALYLVQFYEDGASLLQQLRQLGVRKPLYATSSLVEEQLITLAGPAAEGVKLPSSFSVAAASPTAKAYIAQYRDRFHTDPNLFSAQAYDATNIVLDAIVKGGGAEATRQSVRDALAKTKDFPGVTGVTTFDPQTREPSKQQERLEIKNGAFVTVEH